MLYIDGKEIAKRNVSSSECTYDTRLDLFVIIIDAEKPNRRSAQLL